MKNTNQREYWENYMDYWTNKVKEANDSSDQIKDRAPGDIIIDKYIELLEVKSEEKFLDYGCGFCRSYPFARDHAIDYYGVDIAQNPLDFAVSLYTELEGRLSILDGNRVRYPDSYFNKIFCFGVYDACNQEETLNEILRLLAEDGIALITGKNHNYYDDDKNAFVAEVNARKKGHPNYFTDLEKMILQLEKQGFEIKETRYFIRRNDFAENCYVLNRPESGCFYEFSVLIKKTKKSRITKLQLFSDSYSKTFRRINSVEK